MSTFSHQGSCHCGAVKFEVNPKLNETITCNCSICGRSGHILTFVEPKDFHVIAGDNEQTDYQFNTHNIHFTFCKTCGIRSFANGIGPDGKPMFAVNVRCLDGVDIESLKPHHYDGRSR